MSYIHLCSSNSFITNDNPHETMMATIMEWFGVQLNISSDCPYSQILEHHEYCCMQKLNVTTQTPQASEIKQSSSIVNELACTNDPGVCFTHSVGDKAIAASALFFGGITLLFIGIA